MDSSQPIYNTGSNFSFPSPGDDDPLPIYNTGRNFFSDEAHLRCGLSPPPPRVPGGFDGIDLNSQASSFPNLKSYTDILQSPSTPVIRHGQCHPARRDSQVRPRTDIILRSPSVIIIRDAQCHLLLPDQVPPPRRGGVSRFTRDGPTRQSTHTGSRGHTCWPCSIVSPTTDNWSCSTRWSCNCSAPLHYSRACQCCYTDTSCE